jgi:hypothetical protein
LLDVFYSVRCLDVECDCFSGECLDKDLHFSFF